MKTPNLVNTKTRLLSVSYFSFSKYLYIYTALQVQIVVVYINNIILEFFFIRFHLTSLKKKNEFQQSNPEEYIRNNYYVLIY